MDEESFVSNLQQKYLTHFSKTALAVPALMDVDTMLSQK